MYEGEWDDREGEALGAISSDLGKFAKNPVQVDSKIYTLPLYDTSIGIIYNQVIFKRYELSVPSTYEEFLEVCRVLQKNEVAPLINTGKAD